MVTMAFTRSGDEARTVLAWVQDNPGARAAEGLDRLAPIADSAPTTQALHEVADVAKIVTRLLPGQGGGDGG